MQDAIQKINAEMQENPNDSYTEIIGHYLIDRAGADPAAAERILQKGKTLRQAMKEVQIEAKAKIGNGAGVSVMTPEQVFDVIDQYFGLTKDLVACYRSLGLGGAALPVQSVAEPAAAVDIDLDDFL